MANVRKKIEVSYRLSSEEKAQFKGILLNAFDAANDFTGSEQSFDHLMDALNAVDDYVRTKDKTTDHDTLASVFASQVDSLKLQFNTVSSLLDYANDNVYGMMARLKSLKDILGRLTLGGSHIVYHDNVFVLTDDLIASGDGETPFQKEGFRQQPRLAMLVETLERCDIYTDDLVIRVGKIFETQIRKLPYVIVEIPRLGKQVAVCDQYGETTIVSQNILHPSVWASLSKKEIAALDGVEKVRWGDVWPLHIQNFLLYGSTKMTPEQPIDMPKIDIEGYMERAKKRRTPLTEQMILNHILLHLTAEDEDIRRTFPTRGSGEVRTLPGQHWNRWNGFLERNGSGLTQFITQFIVDQAEKHKGLTGELPTSEFGSLPDYPHIGWNFIDQALLRKKRTLDQLLVQEGLKEGFDGTLTKDFILDHILLHLKKYNRWPFLSLDVDGLPSQTWSDWNRFLKEGARGLSGKSSLRELIDSFICEQALIHQKRYGALPTRESGFLENYPDITWEILEDACLQGTNHRRNLLRVFAAGNIVNDNTLNISEENILIYVLQYFKEHNFTWPTQHVGDVEGFPGETWRLWNSRLSRGQCGLPGNSSIPKLINQFLCGQALIYRDQHNGFLPTRESGSLPDHPDITWENIEDSFLDMVGCTRTNLNRFFKDQKLSEDIADLTEEYIQQHMLSYLSKHKKWPTLSDISVEGVVGEKWRNWNYALVNGSRGLPGNSSLESLATDSIIEQAKLYQQKHDGGLPTYQSGSLDNYPDITWKMIEDVYLIRGGDRKRNLQQIWIEEGIATEKELKKYFLDHGINELPSRVKKKTLPDETLQRLRQVKRIVTDKPLSAEIVLNHILLYLKKHGKWPSASTQSEHPDVETFRGEKWSAWDGHLKNNNRGLQVGLTLMKFIDKFVCDQAEAYKELKGGLPTYQSGSLDDYPDITWEMIETAYMGRRAHKKKLQRVFIEGELIEGQNGLSEDFIFLHVTKYLLIHGRWPVQSSGAVDGLDNEEWMHWNTSLRRGDRGLKGKTTLPNLIAFKIEEEARLYQKQYNGVLPTRCSGELIQYSNITWENVEDAFLAKGGKYKKSLNQFFIERGLVEGGAGNTLEFIP